MKRVVMTLMIILSIVLIPNAYALDFDVVSKNVVFYNLNDDTVLYEKGSNDRVSIASLTKITTGIVAIENIKDINETVTLTYADFAGLVETNAAQAGFYVGETVTYKDLLYALLLPSGADAAQALARNVAGSNEAFVELMNNKAQELGLENTHYVNTTGLDDYGHYSSMVDVATIFKYALKNEIFKEIITTRSYTTSDGYLTFKSHVINTFNTMGIDYILGGKTGTTDDAGLCLATIASYNDVDYMLVTGGVPYVRGNTDHYIDAKDIYSYFTSNYSYKNVIDKDDSIVTLNTLYSKNDSVTFKANKELTLYLDNNFKKENLTYQYNGVHVITPNMDKGTVLGVVSIYNGETFIDSIEIVLAEKQDFDLVKYIKYYEDEIKQILLISGSVLVILIIIALTRKIKVKKKNRQ